jgi:hypothetical protein
MAFGNHGPSEVGKLERAVMGTKSLQPQPIIGLEPLFKGSLSLSDPYS